MPRPATDRNLLFGILALQMDFITRDALVAAMNAWVLEKHRPLGEILVERGALAPARRALLAPLVDEHIRAHENDPAASLAALSSASGIAADLRRSIATDPDLLASLDSLSTSLATDLYATRAPDPNEIPHRGVRFRKVREHAAGNLGIVYIARDEELNREVALKEIKKNADEPHKQAKFLLEAEVTGGLEHPGIVPVYGLGHHDDGRPFYAMRFIRGKSLLDAIKRFHADDTLKSDPGRRTLELQKLLRRFTDVCNAIAYAHSRGVLHRDLKPDNVMVGKYGETLVVDWGLAKALGVSGEAGKTLADPEDPLPEASLQPSKSDHLEATQAGSHVGTPAYMSPEQAAGRLDLLGPSSDIYGLGATLYHLIVGRLPIEAASIQELFAKIQLGEITRPRAVAPWLDPALEAICLKAMALKPEARYTTPKALAEDLDRWIAGEPVTAYPEPWTRRARRWARKHRMALATVGSAATVTAVLLGVFTWLNAAQQEETDSLARASVGRADALAGHARSGGDLALWDKAIAEALLARERLESGRGSTARRREVEARLEAFRWERTSREKDQRIVAELEEARALSANFKDGQFDTYAKLDAYLNSFKTYGLDFSKLTDEEAIERIRSSRVADDLISALDDWALFQSRTVPRKRLQALAIAAETDPVRAGIREAVARRDVAILRKLLERPEDRDKLGSRIRTVFNALLRLDPKASIPHLETIRGERPSDFWINHDLGMAYLRSNPPQAQEAVRCLSVAVALRPGSPGAHYNLGCTLLAQEKIDQSIESYRKAIQLQPGFVEAHIGLGMTMLFQGKLDLAIEIYRQTIQIRPDYAEGHWRLGMALMNQGNIDQAVESYRKAIQINPDFDAALISLGNGLRVQGKFDEAIECCRKAIRLSPNEPMAHCNLAAALLLKHDYEGTITSSREAIRLDPELAEAHANLGLALGAKGDPVRSALALRESARLKLKSKRPAKAAQP